MSRSFGTGPPGVDEENKDQTSYTIEQELVRYEEYLLELLDVLKERNIPKIIPFSNFLCHTHHTLLKRNLTWSIEQSFIGMKMGNGSFK